MTLENESARGKQGRSWQLAAYLVLGLAMLGSLPSLLRVYHVFVTGVTWEQVPFALHQQALWARNEMCASGPGEEADFPRVSERSTVDASLGAPREITAFTGLKVRLQACWNGDVLVRTVLNDGKGRAIWVAAEGFTLEEAGLSLSGQALAQTISAPAAAAGGTPFDILCQAWKNNSMNSGRVTRVVSVGGACTRETINILTGQVMIAETVPCDASCQPDGAK